MHMYNKTIVGNNGDALVYRTLKRSAEFVYIALNLKPSHQKFYFSSKCGNTGNINII